MTITICVTSDMHGRMDRLEQMKSYFDSIRPDVLIDNGDFLQGSLSSYYYDHVKPQVHPMLNLANDIGYDCAVFGNHEFNYPLTKIEEMRAACEFPWISGNIAAFCEPYIVKSVRGQRVAIVGVTTHFTPLWDEQGFTKDLNFTDALEAARFWVQYVYEHEQPDFIILSYHGGFTHDIEGGYAFAKDNGENQANEMLSIPHIDALITGHQHLQIATVVDGIPVLQPGSNGSCIGVITLGDEVSCKLVSVEHVGDSYPDEVSDWLFEKISYCSDDLTYEGLLASRIQKPKFVDFLHNVQMTATGAELSVIELMFHERGGLVGDVTNFDVLKNISRPNTLKVLELTGVDVLSAIEQCAAVFAVNSSGDIDFSYNVILNEVQPYFYDYWGGLSYTIDVSQPVGHRVQDVMFHGRVFELDRTYRVAMNSYRATGVDFESLSGKKCVFETIDLFPTLIMKHIRAHSIVVKNVGDIKVVK